MRFLLGLDLLASATLEELLASMRILRLREDGARLPVFCLLPFAALLPEDVDPFLAFPFPPFLPFFFPPFLPFLPRPVFFPFLSDLRLSCSLLETYEASALSTCSSQGYYGHPLEIRHIYGQRFRAWSQI